jgi:CBS domain-containing protein/ribosome-associated translation inhibitor RaiA
MLMPALFEPLPREFVSETAFYDYKTPATEVLPKIGKHGAVVVLHKREYYGIVDDRSLFRQRGPGSIGLSKGIEIGKFARKLPVLDSGTSIGRLISCFHDFSAKALPYQEGNRITGIVKREVAVSTILSLHMLSKARVADVMSSPVITIEGGANVAQAISIMEKNKIARLAVVDGNGRLLGLLPQRDILEKFAKPQERLPEMKAQAFSPSNVAVASIMRTPAYTIDYSRQAEEAARQMLENKVSAMIVMRDMKPVGVVSMRDIIESAAATMAKTQSRVIVSGLDAYTRDYEGDIRDSANRLIAKIDRFGKTDVDYISINVKRHRERNYEVQARLALRKRGVVFARAAGFSLDSALSGLLESIYRRVKERKESYLSRRRLAERRYEE